MWMDKPAPAYLQIIKYRHFEYHGECACRSSLIPTLFLRQELFDRLGHAVG
ncbi:hypothetical protein PROFUN_03210 [Planoprotostelium fungivorum]|uniref:Uncharacterized protein n=1 Tax=Planoprotostelium fungivorum TaxID=1890364 RepID=A0A2P6NX08_9EUKA|nr:hypothetical protein PROFUN_03210 [Planoprotostelium fungivorum]